MWYVCFLFVCFALLCRLPTAPAPNIHQGLYSHSAPCLTSSQISALGSVVRSPRRVQLAGLPSFALAGPQRMLRLCACACRWSPEGARGSSNPNLPSSNDTHYP
ncbi:uncharacterized protein LY79DRAFT_564454 [Colletotrichum navitas]|uniref:Secreted protein n=1 Tax=Colletotrichum navitas TaxID=681940 RepID=A0AAD8PRF7_9PEZI|nr:uncharacterized protein LY79DRAFT_564454 [Colletotrichum navitas]KAK1579281.1 hypothetical protein LY79DRAFT_564454 [Colletotrichum navitas]